MSRKDNILLSKKFGLNPSLTICFYCGKETGIALMGQIKTKDCDDVEAPKTICNTLEPCDECKEKYKDYVLLVEKPSREENPTGRWVAVKKEALPEDYRNTPIAFMLSEDFNVIIKQFNQDKQKNIVDELGD